ncbi:hypothetical protein B0O99DRAFT_637315 [Bisporella sp. PMI_857]|nr:hypothetical protein B0O99DRAFT_637315 [Bisporella sp. PMI_857]
MKSTALNTWGWLLLLYSKTILAQEPALSSSSLQAQIKLENLYSDLQAIADIATANGNTRAFGTSGYAASVDYILSRVSSLPGMVSSTQDFSAVYARSYITNLTTTGGISYPAYPISSAPSTPSTGITAELVLGSPGTTACNASSYAGRNVRGKIVLVEHAACPPLRPGFHDGVMVAAAAVGAVAVIVYNDIDLVLTAGSLSRANSSDVPMGYINRKEGLELKGRLDRDEEVLATLIAYEVLDERVTQNVLVETVGGDPENVVMFGAHLDSVSAGPGINDNASGCALLLSLITVVTRYTHNLKLRFAFWGAEEKGILGSRHYVKALPSSSASSILAYINFDMVSRGYFGVFDGDGSTFGIRAPPGSDTIEKLFEEGLNGQGVNVTAAPFTNGTDYASFWQVLGKPVGGLFTGTGGAQDPCYHLACDTLSNANVTTLTINAKAAAHVLAVLAMDGTDIIP